MRDAESCVCVWRATQHPEHEFSSNGRAPRLTTRPSIVSGERLHPAAVNERRRGRAR